MPSNRITINNALHYEVPDNNMEKLLRWLKRNGYPVKDDPKAN